MSTAADYQNRTVDLLAWAGPQAAGNVRLTPGLAKPGRGGEICTGIQKLAQRWLIEFLTLDGSIPALPTRGCPFIGQVRRGELHTVLDAAQAFYLSADTVELNLQSEENVEDPADERFDRAELLAITVAGDTISVNVRLYSLAGTSRAVILPIDIKTGQ